MTSDLIAQAVADIKAKRIWWEFIEKTELVHAAIDQLEANDSVIIDATVIYRDLKDNYKPSYWYEDHVVSPPWEGGIIGFVNKYNNVYIVGFDVIDTEHTKVLAAQDKKYANWKWKTENKVEWDRVKWIISFMVWVQPRPGKLPIGPVFAYSWAVYPDGTPADFHWVDLSDMPQEFRDDVNAILVKTFNFMNCRNVKLVEPVRPRAERRRIERTGLRVSQINVFPIGKSYRTTKTESNSIGVPLHTVRGHFAEYGVKGKGLLFGKLKGRFFIPQHVRGSQELGETKQRFIIKDQHN